MDRRDLLKASLAACLAMAVQVAFAQEPGTCPDAGGLFAAYDVVSVKPAHPGSPQRLRDLPDGMDGSTTVDALARAFLLYGAGLVVANGANEDMITGLPNWTKEDYFSIRAKMSPEQLAMFATLKKYEQWACEGNMVEAMLRDRFRLRMHREPRQIPVYELVVAKGGSKMMQATGPDRAMSITPHSAEGGYELTLQAYSMPMKQLTNLLAIAYWGVGRNVIDRTGLTGKYSFTLTFTPPQETGQAGGPANATASDPRLSIFGALEEQLGLRLERTTATFDSVVVDHVERPASD